MSLDPVTLLVAAPIHLLRWAPALSAGASASIAAWAAARPPDSSLVRWLAAHEAAIDEKLRRVHVFTGARRVVYAQGASASALVVAALASGDVRWLAAIALVALAPGVYLDRRARSRRDALEDQLDGFVLALANALKATPNVGTALLSLCPVLDGPMRQELDLLAKELSVGTPLSDALGRMTARIGSRSADAAIGALLVGRKLGGNLPEVLETTAGTLREMRRLDGVIRSKTAEGKAQLWVVGALPFALVVVLGAIMPGFLDPLTESLVGGLIVAACVSLWVGAIVLARTILEVDP